MNRKICYQGTASKLKIVEGEGDAEHLGKEANFLGYYGIRLAQLMREPGLKVVAIDDGSVLNAAGYPGGYEDRNSRVCGVVTEDDMMMEDALKDLEWEKL